MIALSLKEIARALRGEVSGLQVLAPGPGHSLSDRNLAVRPSSTAPDGFIVNSFAGDDFRDRREHVRCILGVDAGGWKGKVPRTARSSRAKPQPSEGVARRDAFAPEQIASIFDSVVPISRTPGPSYLCETCGIETANVADVLKRVDAIDWHQALHFNEPGHPLHGRRLGAIIAILTDPVTAKPTCGILRTYIAHDPRKVGKAKTWGPAGVVRLDRDEDVLEGLHLAEGIETALAARTMHLPGYGRPLPMWAAGSPALMASFPILAGVEALTLVADNDANGAGERAAQAAAERWLAAARREVRIIRSKTLGENLADVAMRRAPWGASE